MNQSDRRPGPYSPDSCAWFLKAPIYRKWRDQPFENSVANDTSFLVDSWQHRVLFVQGESGSLSLPLVGKLTSNSTGRFWQNLHISYGNREP